MYTTEPQIAWCSYCGKDIWFIYTPKLKPEDLVCSECKEYWIKTFIHDEKKMMGFNNKTKTTYDATDSITIDNSDHTLYKEELICLTPVKKFEKPKKIFTKPHHAKKKKGYEY